MYYKIFLFLPIFSFQCLHFESCPPSIYGSRKPLNVPSILHLIPYPWMTRHSIISVCYNILWTFTQTHSLKIRIATFYAFWFFIISVPVGYPQYPSLLLCECLSRARAPTVSLDMLFKRYASSTLTIWFGLLKFSNNYYALGHSRFYDPTVFSFDFTQAVIPVK